MWGPLQGLQAAPPTAPLKTTEAACTVCAVVDFRAVLPGAALRGSDGCSERCIKASAHQHKAIASFTAVLAPSRILSSQVMVKPAVRVPECSET